MSAAELLEPRRYLLIPRREEPLSEEEIFARIGRKLDHDLNGSASNVSMGIGTVRRLLAKGGDNLRQIEVFLGQTQIYATHTNLIAEGIRQLGPNRKPTARPFSLASDLEQVQAYLGQKRKPVELVIDSSLPGKVNNLRTPIYALTVNLAKNACDAMERADKRGEPILIEGSYLGPGELEGTLAQHYEGQNVARVRVRDFGTGVPGDISEIFKLGVSSNEGSERGVGHSLTDRTCRITGGALHIETGPEGTTMDFYFPQRR